MHECHLAQLVKFNKGNKKLKKKISIFVLLGIQSSNYSIVIFLSMEILLAPTEKLFAPTKSLSNIALIIKCS